MQDDVFRVISQWHVTPSAITNTSLINYLRARREL